jgi:hypothetical protein
VFFLPGGIFEASNTSWMNIKIFFTCPNLHHYQDSFLV